MSKLFALSVISLLVYGAIYASPLDREEYAQTDCDILDNNFSHVATIVVATPTDIKDGRKFLYNVDFQPGGPTIRLPPQYYAPDWQDVTAITMEYPSINADAGTLSMKIKGVTGEYVQPVGKVQRACWNTVRAYIERKFPNHSPIVERVEGK